jgi:hypothetical protein
MGSVQQNCLAMRPTSQTLRKSRPKLLGSHQSITDKYYYDYQIKADEMGMTFNTHIIISQGTA